jgi:hypothetical protein
MLKRLRKPVLIFLLCAVAAPWARAQVQPTQADRVSTYRKCEMQRRMFDGYCWVSIVDLIANPELFDGQKVLVQGYVHLEFEGNGVYLHRDDFRYHNSRNGLWLATADAGDLSKCQDSYAMVKGMFKAGVGGHFDLYGGVLEHITACTKVEPREK